MPTDTPISPQSSTATLVTDTSQQTVTTCNRPVPAGPPSTIHTAVSTKYGQTSTKPPDTRSWVPRRGYWEAVQDSVWGFELLSLLFALTSTIAVCVILGHANNRLLSDWTLPIQPNSLVSIFSTLAKTALMLPIASVISQMKWIWFEEPRNLAHLQSFDKASRGPWGATRLIWDLISNPSGWTAKAACVMTIAALAFEPTAQQVISFETRETQVQNATAQLWTASSWNSSSLNSGTLSPTKQIGLRISLLNALMSEYRDFPPRFTCTAQTYSWDEVESLSACSSCSKWQQPTFSLVPVNSPWSQPGISDLYTAVAPSNVTVGAPMDDSLFPSVTMYPVLTIFDTETDSNMDHVSGSFLRFAAVNHSTNEPESGNSSLWKWRQNETVDHFLCRIHPCVKTLKNVIVRNGAYSFDSQTTKWLIRAGNGYIYRTDEAGSAPEWIVDFYTSENLNQMLGTMLSTRLHRIEVPEAYRWGYIDSAIASLLFESNLTTIMGALSDVISAEMRSNDNLAVKSQSGAAWEPRTFVVVSWAWMPYPLAILAATTATLATAMIKTSKRLIVYKDSAIALLSLGIGHMDSANPDKPVRGDTVGQRYTAYQVEAEASGLTAKLFKDDKGDYMFLKC